MMMIIIIIIVSVCFRQINFVVLFLACESAFVSFHKHKITFSTILLNNVKKNTRLQLLWRYGMRGAVPPLSLYSLMAYISLRFIFCCLYVHAVLWATVGIVLIAFCFMSLCLYGTKIG
jgi:hypothetical protein